MNLSFMTLQKGISWASDYYKNIFLRHTRLNFMTLLKLWGERLCSHITKAIILKAQAQTIWGELPSLLDHQWITRTKMPIGQYLDPRVWLLSTGPITTKTKSNHDIKFTLVYFYFIYYTCMWGRRLIFINNKTLWMYILFYFRLY